MDAQRPDLTLTFGAFEISLSVVMFLTGIATLQIWNYFRDYQKDPRHVHLLAAFVYIGDIFHSALLVHALYDYTITSFGDFLALQTVTWSLKVSIVLSGLVTCIVQTFFCVRIYRITSVWIIACICWILALTRLACDLGLAAEVSASGKFGVLQTTKAKALGLAVLFVGAASDVLIAGFICFALLRTRSGYNATTDKLVDKIVAFTIGSGLLTSVVAVVEAVLFATLDNFVFLAFYCITPKLFSNSLLASLNERNYTRREIAAMDFSLRSARAVSAHVMFNDPRSQFELTTGGGRRSESNLSPSTSKVNRILHAESSSATD